MRRAVRGHRRLPARKGAENFTADGWFKTGDVAIASPNGYFVIADRTKDLIKSGGEWISSVDMEDRVMQMDGVPRPPYGGAPSQMAGAPAGLHRAAAWRGGAEGAEGGGDAEGGGGGGPRVKRAGGGGGGCSSDLVDRVHAHLLAGGFARWQLPDRVEVIDAVPVHVRRKVRQEVAAGTLRAEAMAGQGAERDRGSGVKTLGMQPCA